MRQALTTTVFLALLLVVQTRAWATSEPLRCALTERQFSEQVDALAATPGNWRGIQSHQQRHFPPCADDGLFAQAHSELIVQTLASGWGRLGDLSALAQEHPEFKRFVFRHVNARSSKADLQTVLTYATIRCPRGQAAFCSELRQLAAVALQTLQ